MDNEDDVLLKTLLVLATVAGIGMGAITVFIGYLVWRIWG